MKGQGLNPLGFRRGWHAHRHGVLFPAVAAHSRMVAPGAAQQQVVTLTWSSLTARWTSVQCSRILRRVGMELLLLPLLVGLAPNFLRYVAVALDNERSY